MNRFVITSGLLLALFSARASSATLSVPQQFATIQAAIDAAAPGDTVRVSKGVYHEAVVIQNKAIHFVAKGAAVIDGRLNGAWLGNCVMIVNAAGTVVDGFTLRHCGSGSPSGTALVVASNDVRIEDVRVFAASGAGIRVTGSQAQILRSTVNGCNGGIVVTGPSALVEGCVVEHDGKYGMDINGQGSVIRKCRIETINDGNGLRVGDPSPLVEKTIVRGVSKGVGVLVNGQDAVLRKLTLSFIGKGAPAIRVNAPSCSIEQTVISDCGSSAVEIMNAGNGCHMIASRFERCGTLQQPTVDVDSFDGFMKKCIVREGDGHGVLVESDYFVIVDSHIERCRLDGIHVTDTSVSCSIEHNTVLDCHGEGLDIRHDSTILKNVAHGNRTDYSAPFIGIGVMKTNKFGTAGPAEVD